MTPVFLLYVSFRNILQRFILIRYMALGLLLPLPASAIPADALDDATRLFFEQAEKEAEGQRWAQAAMYYRMVLNKDPSFLPASLGLGQALERSGDRDAALRLYRSLGDEADAVEALAKLVGTTSPMEALRLWQRLETLRLGDPIPHCEQVRLRVNSPELADPDAAIVAWRTCMVLGQGGEPEGELLLSFSGHLLAAGRSEGEELLRSYLESYPEGGVASDVRLRLDRIEVERAAAQLPLRSGEPLVEAQLLRLREGYKLLATGAADEAKRHAEELVAEAPRSADAHGLLSEAFAERSRWSDAEIHAVIARNLAPDDAGTRLRLGLLLERAYGGRRDQEAAVELREAAALRPESPELLYRLGVLEQSLGNWEAAIARLEASVRLASQGEQAEDARYRLESLRRSPPSLPANPAEPLSSLPAAAASHYRIALELFRRARAGEAELELEAALAFAPDAPELLNRKARLRLEAGRIPEALALWQQSLRADPLQGSVLLLLGELSERGGEREKAEDLYERAARAGEADGHYLLARLAAERADWTRVRAELEAWEETASTTSPYREAAQRLLEETRRRYLLTRGAALALALLVLGVPVLVWVRRRTAKTLRDLLDGAPECWHDAARILAGLRHEVLKHNTTVLPDVAAALERGNRVPWQSLSAQAPELCRRFIEHLDALESLGARFDIRLDLRYRDPILSPMFHAFKRLSRLKNPRPAELRALSQTINGAGYAALGRIVQEICVLAVTPDLVEEVYARVSAEPGIAGTAVPELVLREESVGLAVRMFRNDLEDILANLLRNALAAGATTLELVLAEDDDPVTGVGSIEIRIVDNAPGTLTNAMIRGRYIGRGLGLAVDIINRHEGSIRVQPGPESGMKAVVVQLPRVEPASVEAEWTA